MNGAGFAFATPKTIGATGRTPAPDGGLGDLGADGWTALVGDIGPAAAVVAREHPGMPLVLLGHSMGSFAVQQDLLDHSADVDAVVLTGTAVLDCSSRRIDLDAPPTSRRSTPRSSRPAPTTTG